MAQQYLHAKEAIDVLDFGFSLADAIQSSREDGKVNWLDAPKFVPLIPKAIAAVKNIDEAYAEIISPEGRDEVLDYVIGRFDIEDDEAEVLVERTLAFVLEGVAIGENIAHFIKERKAAKEG